MNTETTPASPIDPADIVIHRIPPSVGAPSVPTHAHAATPNLPAKADRDALYELLRMVIEACGPTATKHDRAIAAITVCIDQGVATLPHLIGVLRPLEFHQGHIAHILKDGTGSDPSRYRWYRDAEGIHHLHPTALDGPPPYGAKARRG